MLPNRVAWRGVEMRDAGCGRQEAGGGMPSAALAKGAKDGQMWI